MGYRFNLEHANWLAHLLQPSGPTPRLADNAEREILHSFLNSFEKNYYPSPAHQRLFNFYNNEAFREAVNYPNRPIHALEILQEYFRHMPWFAMLIPSKNDNNLSEITLLKELVQKHPYQQGLILQILDVSEDLRLDHVFPAFRCALAESTKWPGVLLWTSSNEGIFLPTKSVDEVKWIFDWLSKYAGIPSLSELKREFGKIFSDSSENENKPLQVVHLSDLHLGSEHATLKLLRVKSIIRGVFQELQGLGPILPVLTGDLVDTPNQSNLERLRDFLNFIQEESGTEPISILGNHDMRQDGWLLNAPAWAVEYPKTRVHWHDETKVRLVCFNSASKGSLARGRIDQSEYDFLGSILDDSSNHRKSFTTVALLHHHPIPVNEPEWRKKSWYERLLGDFFEQSGVMENSAEFLQWCKKRKIITILHGHKHIPRCDVHEGITVIGCGSTFGKIETKIPTQTYLSLNLVTIDTQNKKIGCRLRAERVPGAGLEEQESHELVFTKGFSEIV